jgi:hypothetical protein
MSNMKPQMWCQHLPTNIKIKIKFCNYHLQLIFDCTKHLVRNNLVLGLVLFLYIIQVPVVKIRPSSDPVLGTQTGTDS